MFLFSIRSKILQVQKAQRNLNGTVLVKLRFLKGYENLKKKPSNFLEVT